MVPWEKMTQSPLIRYNDAKYIEYFVQTKNKIPHLSPETMCFNISLGTWGSSCRPLLHCGSLALSAIAPDLGHGVVSLGCRPWPWMWGTSNNLRYADDTTLMAESEEKLKSLLTKWKKESKKVGLKLSIKKIKIMTSGPITSWEIDGETVSDFILRAPKSLQMVTAAMKLKDTYSLERKLWPT